MQVVFLRPGLSGLVLLRLLLRMPIGFPVVWSLIGVWFLGVVRLSSSWSGLVGIRSGRCVVNAGRCA